MIAARDVEVKIEIDPGAPAASDVEILIGDSSKFRADTGWEPRIPFDQTLRDLLDYWRDAAPRARRASRPEPGLRLHVLVTGISGFVGPRLARHLLERGDRVSGTYPIDRPPRSRRAGRCACTRSTCWMPRLERAVARGRAGRHRQPRGAVARRRVVEADGRLLPRQRDGHREPAGGRRRAAGGDRLSAEVYGLVPEERAADRGGAAGRSPHALRADQGGGGAARPRPRRRGGPRLQPGGPGRPPSFALPTFAAPARGDRAEAGESRPARRQPLGARDFVHVDDGAAGVRLLAEKGERGGIYNIASGRAPAICEALDA